jgi:hypothetical protein
LLKSEEAGIRQSKPPCSRFDQDANTEPFAATAVSWTRVPAGNFAPAPSQPGPQFMPAGTDVTVPIPVASDVLIFGFEIDRVYIWEIPRTAPNKLNPPKP